MTVSPTTPPAGRAPLDLNGPWAFRFEEGKSFAETDDPAFAATDTVAVPGAAPASIAVPSPLPARSKTPGSSSTAWG